MPSDRASHVMIWLLGALLIALIGIGARLVYNSSGPVHETYGVVLASRYEDGLTPTADSVGEGFQCQRLHSTRET
jgi:hypothetical protein